MALAAATLRDRASRRTRRLDPHRARTSVGRMVFTSMCDKLVDVTDELEIAPQLASTVVLDNDNRTLTFQLRDDVRLP